MQLAGPSRGGDGGATGARDVGTGVGKKTEEVVVVPIGDTSVGDENIFEQESGVVGGVGTLVGTSLSITLQLQEHRLPVGHCQLCEEEKETVAAPGSARACCTGQQGSAGRG